VRPAVTITRRTVLAGGLVTLVGCSHPQRTPPPAAPAPDAAALASAIAVEQQLLGAATDPATQATHAAHLTALGGSTPPSASPPAAAGSADATRVMLRASAQSLHGAAVTAVIGRHAAVFASIAASHEVLLGD
jgi:hypothetical protein